MAKQRELRRQLALPANDTEDRRMCLFFLKVVL